jgi:hypothetical protein
LAYWLDRLFTGMPELGLLTIKKALQKDKCLMGCNFSFGSLFVFCKKKSTSIKTVSLFHLSHLQQFSDVTIIHCKKAENDTFIMMEMLERILVLFLSFVMLLRYIYAIAFKKSG